MCPQSSTDVRRPLPVVPAPDAALEDEDLPCEDPVPLLLQVQVVSVLQEHLQSINQSVSPKIKIIINKSINKFIFFK